MLILQCSEVRLGSGKSQTGLIRFLRYVHDPEFVGYVIRKAATDLKGSGGLFDKAVKLFKQYDDRVTYTKQPMRINFPSGASIFFTGLDGQAGMDSLQGIEISAAMIDEATHLTEEEVWWVISRLRTNAKMSPNIWLTCNPDIDSFLFNWVQWYLYPEGTVVDDQLVEGRPDPKKNCTLRYFLTDPDGKMIWGDSKEYFYKLFPELTSPETDLQPESFVFIGATCKDNPLMLKANPKYESSLMNNPNRIKRERLYYGNWLAREEEAGYFKKEWVGELLNPMNKDDMSYLSKVVRRVRCYDLAGSVPSEKYPSPDWTVGVLIARTSDGNFIIEDMVRWRKRSGETIEEIMKVAKEDKKRYGNVQLYLPEDPAAAGKTAKVYQSKLFSHAGIPVKFIKVGTKNSKLKRFEPFSNAPENGLVKVVKGLWNDAFFSELEGFDGVSRTKKDDICDSCSDGFNVLATTKEYKKFNLSLLG